MAINNSFLGISLEFNESLSQFKGFSLELTENLIIKVVDSLGNPVNAALVDFKIQQETETALTDETGTVGFFVEEQSTVTVSATFECLFTDEIDVLHGGIDDFKSITLLLVELPCLDTEPLNGYNFIRWQLSNNLTLPLDLPLRDCTNCNNVDFDTPIGLQRPLEDYTCYPYMPIMIQGETYSFFTNFNEDLQFSKILTNKLKVGFLKDGEGTISESFDCNVLSDIVLSNNFYAEFKPQTIENGIYQLVIYNSGTNVIYCISNQIYVNSNARLNQTALLKYRNSDDIDGFKYTELPEYYNRVRIDLYRGEAREYEPEVEEENQIATGEKRYISLANRLSLPVTAEFLDDLACEGLESFVTHDEIYVNGKRYNSNAEIDYEQLDLGFNKFRCNFKLFDYDYARKNRYK